jgi:protoporphyrinogen oxidase
VIVGAGPAGLTAAWHLARSGETALVLEGDDVVGGISRTVERDGWRFDIGGHRFFTKVPEVERVWHEILPPEEFPVRPRLSRIYYRRRFFDYPLKAGNALRGLGFVEAVLCVLSYAWARVRPPKDRSTFEGWTVSRFGWRLYRTFFKTYTEKVWGVPADEIQADWAAQRIKNLSLLTAVWHSVRPGGSGTDVTSLIEEFHYPTHGPGHMWERCRELVEARGTKVLMETRVTAVHREAGAVVAVTAETEGVPTRYAATDVISSMPLSELVLAMDPPAPDDVRGAALDLGYRDFLTVALVVPESCGFPDNWIYVHEPGVRLGRVQNFGSWSPDMVKEGRTCLGLEYFVFEGDDLWTMDDAALVDLGTRELAALGLVDAGAVEAGYVVRMPKAYPMYDDRYKANVEVIRGWIEREVPNVHPVGRNGMHRYNNQDHSMLTAMLAVENVLGADHEVWSVNVEDEYHEERTAAPTTGRDAPVLPREVIEAHRGRVAADR